MTARSQIEDLRLKIWTKSFRLSNIRVERPRGSGLTAIFNLKSSI